MKKTLLMILSLVLCLSMLTGCFSSFKEAVKEDIKDAVQNNAAQNTEKPNGENNDDNNTEGDGASADKQIAIDSFNKIDLSAFAGTSVDYLETLKTLINESSFALDLNLSGTVGGEEGNADIDVRMKDGKLYFKVESEGEESYEEAIESFVVFNGNFIDTYANFSVEGSDGWQKHSQDITEIINQLAAMYDSEMTTQLLSKIVIPKLEEKHLSDKNGMLLLSNDYIIELVVANAELLAGGEDITEADVEDLKEIIAMSLEELGLAIYLGTGEEMITKVAVEAKEEDTSFYVELALTADGSALDHLTFKMNTEFGGADVKYAPETVINAKAIYDEEGNAVGLDVDGTMYVAGMSRGRYETVSDFEEKYIRESIIQKAVFDGVLDFGAIGKDNADIFKLDLDIEPVKVIETVTLENWDTGEETLISVKEGDVSEYDSNMSLLVNLKSENVNKTTFTFDMSDGDYTVLLNGFVSVAGENVSLEFKCFDDGEEMFAFSGSVTSEDPNTITFAADLSVAGENNLTFSGELYVGEDVVIPALPSDYEVVDNNPLFGGEVGAPEDWEDGGIAEGVIDTIG